MNRIQEFHADHQKVVSALFDLRQAIAAQDIARVRSIVNAAADTQSAQVNLELIYEHPISCDGLSLWMERLPENEQQELLEKMQEVRRQGTRLSEYYRERQKLE